MPKAKLVVLSNPTSAAAEDAYNKWYSDIHAAEVVALPGIRSMTRFRALKQVAPESDTPLYRYCAIYEFDDSEEALRGLAGAVDTMDLSGPIDFDSTLAISYEAFFTYEKGVDD